MFPLLLAMANPVSVCVAPRVDLSYELLGSIRRSSVAFTEGFIFHEGKLLESAGRYLGQPVTLNEINPKTGKVRVLREAPKWRGATVFGEGLARQGNRYYQLTYDSGVAFVYDAATWKHLETIQMVPELREGWGLAPLGRELLMSNGSPELYVLDSTTLQPNRRLLVRDFQGRPLNGLNMLQVLGDTVYANVFPTDQIVQIDLSTGCLVGQLDLSALWLEFSDQELRAIRGDARSNVLNGIAYDPATKTFFVTGKNWPRIFRLRIKR